VLSPTATQASRDAQATLLSSLIPSGPPKRLGCGFRWIDHLLPSQPSPNLLLALSPTAVQATRERHATLINGPPLARSIDQVVPLERSTSTAAGRLGFIETDSPTAVQAPGDVQDTLVSRLLSPGPAGAGTGSTDHAPPFQRSTNGT
jgi:hypothetical protein